MMAPDLQTKPWSAPQKFLFYFGFLYVTLYAFPFPIQLFTYILDRLAELIQRTTGWGGPGWVMAKVNLVLGYWTDFLHWLIPAFAKQFLRLPKPITVFSNGSGDTTYDYVLVLVFLILSLIGAVVWFLLGRKYTTHLKAKIWWLTILRYLVAWMMVSYGMAKVIQTQFPAPGLTDLVQPYGEASPMGLAWNFMGFSYGYNLFTGGCEVIGGLLLFFRRTQTFGALFTMSVISVVFVMNLCFDIPVKLFSFHLLVFATIIALQDGKRLWQFFVSKKEAVTATWPPLYRFFRWPKAGPVVKGLFLAALFYNETRSGLEWYHESGDGAPKPPLYGVYNIEYKLVNGDTAVLQYKDTVTWKQVIVQWKGYARTRLINDSARGYTFRVDSVKKNIEYFPNQDSTVKYSFAYQLEGDRLILNGLQQKDTVQLVMRRFDEKKFLLTSRGFHWINEYPFNR